MSVEIPADKFHVKMIALHCMQTWEIHFNIFDMIFINSVYVLLSFQCLVTMHSKWQAFLETYMFMNSSLQKWKSSKVNLEVSLAAKDWKAASNLLVLSDILPSFRINL
jgi:hypothetical protein